MVSAEADVAHCGDAPVLAPGAALTVVVARDDAPPTPASRAAAAAVHRGRMRTQSADLLTQWRESLVLGPATGTSAHERHQAMVERIRAKEARKAPDGANDHHASVLGGSVSTDNVGHGADVRAGLVAAERPLVSLARSSHDVTPLHVLAPEYN